MPNFTLSHKPSRCENCPLHCQTSNPYVPTEVVFPSTEAQEKGTVDVLFVGEHPSKIDYRYDLPFAGKSGNVFRREISRISRGKLTFAFSNVVRCPPIDEEGKVRKLTKAELNLCTAYVRADIKQLKPRIIVLMGNAALQMLNPDKQDLLWSKGSVSAARAQSKLARNIQWFTTYDHRSKGTSHLAMADVKRALEAALGIENKLGRLGDYKIVKTIEQFDWLKNHIIHELGPGDKVAFDTETTSLNRVGPNKLLTVQFAWDDHTGWVVPYQHPETPFLPHEIQHIKEGLREIFTTKESTYDYIVPFNAQFDVGILQRFLEFYEPGPKILCALFAMYLLDENRAQGPSGGYSLKGLALELLGFTHYTQEMLERRQGKLDTASLDFTARYGGMDAYVTYRLIDKLLEMAGDYKENLIRFATRWYGRVARAVPVMERNGLYIDQDTLISLQSESSPILSRMAEVQGQLYALPEVKAANKRINGQDSRTKGMRPLFKRTPWLFSMTKKDHLLSLFFDELGLKPVGYGNEKTDKYPKGIPSIDKAFYSEHQGVEAVDMVGEYVKLRKLSTSYVKNLLDFLANDPDMQDGRIRPQLQFTRTVTTRVASKNPNTQQLPGGKSKNEKAIKSLISAPPGSLVCEVDVKQAEVRVWAAISDDTQFIKLFEQMKEAQLDYRAHPTPEMKKKVELECDIHRKVASIMFKCSLADVDSMQRQAAKGIGFGAIFGQGAPALAQRLKCSVSEAEELSAKFLQEFKHAYSWLTDIEVFGERHGYVVDLFGRRRHLHEEFAHKSQGVRNRAKRQSRNSPIQGSSSNIVVHTICNLQDYIIRENLNWKLINMVHDAVVQELLFDQALIAVPKTIEIMEDLSTLQEAFGFKMKVPWEMDAKLGVAWGNCHDWDPAEPLEPIVEKIQEEQRLLLAA